MLTKHRDWCDNSACFDQNKNAQHEGKLAFEKCQEIANTVGVSADTTGTAQDVNSVQVRRRLTTGIGTPTVQVVQGMQDAVCTGGAHQEMGAYERTAGAPGCREFHYGPMCSACIKNYRRNPGGYCAECTEDLKTRAQMGFWGVIITGIILLFAIPKFWPQVEAKLDELYTRRVRAIETRMGIDKESMLKIRIQRMNKAESEMAEHKTDVPAMSDGDYGEEAEQAQEIDAQVQREASEIMMKVKILIGLCQVLSAFSSNFPKVPWPEELMELMNSMGFVNFDLLNSQGIACITDTQFVDSFMMMLIMPPVAAGFLVMLYVGSNFFIIHNSFLVLLQSKATHIKLFLSLLFQNINFVGERNSRPRHTSRVSLNLFPTHT